MNWTKRQEINRARVRTSVYKRLKGEGVMSQLEWASTFRNSETNEIGYNFTLRDGRTGRIVLGEEAIQWDTHSKKLV